MEKVEAYYWRCSCGAEHDERDYSLFAMCLRAMLFDTNMFTETEWGQFFHVRPGKIADWCFDRDIPRPYNLSMLVLTIERSSDTLKAPLYDWQEMEQMRATKVSPFGARMLPTVHEYRSRLIFDDLNSQLAKLKPTEQAKLLLELYPET